jgi:hypothetical protein
VPLAARYESVSADAVHAALREYIPRGAGLVASRSGILDAIADLRAKFR